MRCRHSQLRNSDGAFSSRILAPDGSVSIRLWAATISARYAWARAVAAFRPDWTALRPGNKTVTGIFLGAEFALQHERVHEMIQRHLEDVARGALEVAIDREFPLSEAAAAHAHVESRRAFGRVLLIP